MPAVEIRPQRSSISKTAPTKIKVKKASKSRTVRAARFRINSFLMLGAVLVIIFGYISLHASITKTGFDRNEIEKKIELARIENQRLRFKWNNLNSPQKIDNYAMAQGMVYASKYEHLIDTKTVAELP